MQDLAASGPDRRVMESRPCPTRQDDDFCAWGLGDQRWTRVAVQGLRDHVDIGVLGPPASESLRQQRVFALVQLWPLPRDGIDRQCGCRGHVGVHNRQANAWELALLERHVEHAIGRRHPSTAATTRPADGPARGGWPARTTATGQTARTPAAARWSREADHQVPDRANRRRAFLPRTPRAQSRTDRHGAIPARPGYRHRRCQRPRSGRSRPPCAAAPPARWRRARMGLGGPGRRPARCRAVAGGALPRALPIGSRLRCTPTRRSRRSRAGNAAFHGSSSRVLPGSDDSDRRVGVLEGGVAHRAEQKTSEASRSTTSDDGQRGAG